MLSNPADDANDSESTDYSTDRDSPDIGADVDSDTSSCTPPPISPITSSDDEYSYETVDITQSRLLEGAIT